MPISGGGAGPVTTPVNPPVTAPSTSGATASSIGLQFAAIAPGTNFMMGSPVGEAERDSDEGPQHQVTFARGFEMGKHEVTQAQWRAVMGTNPSKFAGCDQCPVEMVSWNDAQAFIARLNSRNDGYTYSLPTEAQFEYCMRGGTTGAVAGEPDRLGWFFPNSGFKTHAVGTKAANAFGIFDLHGNIQEWIQDVYTEDYSGHPTDGSAHMRGPDTDLHVIRGGSWLDHEKYFRSAWRVRRASDDHHEYNGFRVVRMRAAR
jgi:formylglycine-generating enzyme required for sulfatase activity